MRGFYHISLFGNRQQMLREYSNDLKNYNLFEKLTEGYFIDAKDEGRWKVARVQQIKKLGHRTCVEVMFDGYSQKYN